MRGCEVRRGKDGGKVRDKAERMMGGGGAGGAGAADSAFICSHGFLTDRGRDTTVVKTAGVNGSRATLGHCESVCGGG